MTHNQVTLIGYLTADPRITFSDNEAKTKIARFTVATRRDGGKKSGTDFPPCVAFGAVANFAEKWFHKGTSVIIMGYVHTTSYTKGSSQRMTSTEVYVEKVNFNGKNADDADVILPTEKTIVIDPIVTPTSKVPNEVHAEFKKKAVHPTNAEHAVRTTAAEVQDAEDAARHEQKYGEIESEFADFMDSAQDLKE